MKKMFMSLSIILSMILMLTSCDVHFGSKHYDVAWWVIAIPVCLFSMIMLYAGGKHISNHEFVCPECNKTLKEQVKSHPLVLFAKNQPIAAGAIGIIVTAIIIINIILFVRVRQLKNTGSRRRGKTRTPNGLI